MPIRFSTEAANADVLGEDPDAPAGSVAAGLPQARDSDRPRDRFERSRDTYRSQDREVRPGKDINAAGFVKDKDSTRP